MSTPLPSPPDSRHGLVYGLSAYGLWGVSPLFWHAVDHVPPHELIAHRVAWGFAFFFGWSLLTGQLGALRAILADRRVRLRLATTALCIASNWFVFVYAVMVDRVLDVSLGYFMNPLVSVALGRFVLGERLRPLQAVAVAIAGGGVALFALATGGLPWISLVLALSFGLYGLLRKTTAVPPVAGSAFETLALLPVAAGVLVWLQLQGHNSMFAGSVTTDVLLLGTGPVTAIPLLLFVNAARRLRLTTIGFLQYLAPSLQFVLAVAVFDEAIRLERMVAFGLVWAALGLFSLDAWRQRS